MSFLTEYSRKGCEFECAVKKAISFCRCLPWNYPNNFTAIPICDTFGAHCFDKIMSDEKFYKQCQDHCLEDCEDTTSAIWHTFLPLNTDEVCKEGQLIYQHLNQTFRKHFAFENYKVSVMTFFGNSIACRLIFL